MSEIFQTLDTNNDGVLTLEEVETGLLSLNIIQEAAEIRELFREIDVDGDGKIEYSDWMVATSDQTTFKEEKYLRRAFQALDKVTILLFTLQFFPPEDELIF